MPLKRFSIVITCHNQREFIREAVESALAQSGIANEVIVVDDGSTDGSSTILEGFAGAITLAALPDNRGALEARNHGASLASGEYLVFLDGDDALRPWALEIYERLIVDRAPEVILAEKVWCKGVLPPSREEDVPDAIEFAQYETLLSKDRSAGMSASTFVVHRSVFWQAGGWSPDIFHLDCYDLCTKVGVAGRTILVNAPRTALYRIHSTNSIHSVRPFIRMAHYLMDREAAGLYPGGRRWRFQRRAWLGGMIFFWTKRALRAGLYVEALGLACRGFPMIAAGAWRRGWVRVIGQRPFETIGFERGAPEVAAHGGRAAQTR